MSIQDDIFDIQHSIDADYKEAFNRIINLLNLLESENDQYKTVIAELVTTINVLRKLSSCGRYFSHTLTKGDIL